MNITVKVIPRAHKNGIVSFENNILKVRLTAAPEKGEANDLLIEILADALDIPKSSITLVRGKSSRTKLVRIEASNDKLLRKLGNI